MLAKYQESAVYAIRDSVLAADAYQEANPGLRQAVARRVGATLLQAPTGSGKTLMVGRALEAIRGKTKTPVAWFWFAPFSGLVAQTRDALAEQCPSLRLRDVSRDRSALLTGDGDVFIQTWALVAARSKESRKVRRKDETASLDDMLGDLRDRGVRIGVVIDEAHLNFGTTAKAAADFYLNVLRPDFTILATATPNDEKLEAFEEAAGVTVENRVTISRQQAVKEGLNKKGLTLGVVRLDGADARYIEPEQAALTIAWMKHQQIKARLAERGANVTPLMLVQVEDQPKGGEDPIKRVKERLLELRVPESAIATHTSGEPDPDFHTLAYDPSREVLIFKVTAATGFDAPRAWTLVSVRPTRGTQFGLQVVGRIMRVHPKVRAQRQDDDLLDRGWVYLTDPELQGGLESAAAELKAVKDSIATVADELQVLEFSSEIEARLADRHIGVPRANALPKNAEERQMRLDALIGEGFVDVSIREAPAEVQDKIVIQGEFQRALNRTPLFGDVHLGAAPPPGGGAAPRETRVYRLRRDRGVPDALLSERAPKPEQMDGVVVKRAASLVFAEDRTPFDELLRTQGQAIVSLRDLFIEGQPDQERFSVRMSEARIAEAAQTSFEFNQSISARALKAELMDEFRRRAVARGMESDEKAMRRALELFALNRPHAIPEALKSAQATAVDVGPAEAIPDLRVPEDVIVRPSRLGAYEVFPPNMNANERRFAEMLDADESGQVKWWLRLQENAAWAVTLMLPNGKRFFPDFAVGVAGRRTTDAIALVETKDDGVNGRAHSEINREKIRARHREYRNVFWTWERDGRWEEMGWHPELERIEPLRRFSIERLVMID
ncbi:DEAD/DEAH box helicase family protein [Brevundimonas sp.]|uniref:DEAD/DEAH box helicase family protein n=1 Tax=Brevundimonas sp. TaxID=1871086 RepID=UPI0026116BE7|nr:DEAD/DEAH box helicase family protein [Brevundimonas sp.]